MKYISYFAAFCSLIFMLSACSKQVSINGNVMSATGKTLYLLHEREQGWMVEDSVSLSVNGKFKFTIPSTRFIEFYRISLADESVVLAVDSTSKRLTVSATKGSFVDAVVSGSKASEDIAVLRKSAYNLQRQLSNRGLADSLITSHKQLAQSVILSNTASPAAYYAIFQTIAGAFVFHPSNASDLPYWTAVATGFDLKYPDFERTTQLKAIVLAAQKEVRRARMADSGMILNANVSGLVDLNLPNRAGENVSLSSLKGKVVLLDFSAYALESSAAHTLFLRELYDDYHHKGFEIYQVSSDIDKLLWMERSRQVPWISVRDENAPRSMSIISYNVTELPTFFLISSDGDVVGRYNHENVRSAVDALCK